jgi:phage terminase small subunit
MKKLTLKQLNFAEQYLETGNATEAADRVYKPKNRATARAIGSENLAKPNIRAFLDENAGDAAAMIYKLSQAAKNETVRLNASRDILDRTGYRPADKANLDKPRIEGVTIRIVDGSKTPIKKSEM